MNRSKIRCGSLATLFFVRQSCGVVYYTVRLPHEIQKFVAADRCTAAARLMWHRLKLWVIEIPTTEWILTIDAQSFILQRHMKNQNESQKFASNQLLPFIPFAYKLQNIFEGASIVHLGEHRDTCVVSLSKTIHPHCLVLVKPRKPSQNDWKITDRDVKDQNKQTNKIFWDKRL